MNNPLSTWLGTQFTQPTIKLHCVYCSHKCLKCWWLALAEQKTITKPLLNSSFNPGPPEGPIYPVPTIIRIVDTIYIINGSTSLLY